MIEGTRRDDPEACAAAMALNKQGERLIADYIALQHPEEASCVADAVSTTLSGLSTKARDRHVLDRLLETAKTATLAIERALPA